VWLVKNMAYQASIRALSSPLVTGLFAVLVSASSLIPARACNNRQQQAPGPFFAARNYHNSKNCRNGEQHAAAAKPALR
jgi:hypothetical protein